MRFRHTPCLLLQCAMFAKASPDGTDSEHHVVLDVKPAGADDNEYRKIAWKYSIYKDIPDLGPCRLIYNIPALHCVVRARNVTMNIASAPSAPMFCVPPLPLCPKEGPDVQLVVRRRGNLFVQMTWACRVLHEQPLKFVQIGFRRQSIEAPWVDMQAFTMPSSMVVDEFPASVPAACTSEFPAESKGKGGASKRQYLCRHCMANLTHVTAEDDATVKAASSDLRRKCSELGGILPKDIPPHDPDNDQVSSERVPHLSEEIAGRVERRRVEQRSLEEILGRPAPEREVDAWSRETCSCRDLVLREVLPVDGENVIQFGSTYSFRVRVQDGLNWSPWAECAEPVPMKVPPVRPLPQLSDPSVPMSSITAEVLLMKIDFHTEMALLRVLWPRFEGVMTEVEYRILMWCLTPEQRKAAMHRQPSWQVSRNALPQMPETLVLSQMTPISKVPEGEPELCVRAGVRKPSTLTNDGLDRPHVITHIPPAPDEQFVAEKKRLCADVEVPYRLDENCYVFGIEAKYSRGSCGNLSEWSFPVLSKVVELAIPRSKLEVKVEAITGGSLVHTGRAFINSNPKDEAVVYHGPPLSYAEQHASLVKAKPLWPKPTEKRSTSMHARILQGSDEAAEKAAFQGILQMVRPERRPTDDDFREK